jgi:hypothetical protein
MILTMSRWSSGLPVCFLPQGTQVQIPWGDLRETGILLLTMSRYSMVLMWRKLFAAEKNGSQKMMAKKLVLKNRY